MRDAKSALATRFELRAPNPKTNTYLVLAAAYMAMLDGIKAALTAEKTPKELEASLSKKYGEEDFYLEKDREYRSERDVFEDFTCLLYTSYLEKKIELPRPKSFAYLRVVDPIAYGYIIETGKLLKCIKDQAEIAEI